MSALQNALNAIEALGRKRCAERGESWDEMQARLQANVEAQAAKENASYHARALAGFAKAMFTPKSNVSEEEWAERRAENYHSEGRMRHPDYTGESTYRVINGEVA